MRYSDIVSSNKKLGIKFGEFVVNVVYDSTKANHKDLTGKEIQNNKAYNINVLLLLVKEWDLTDDNNNVFPLTYEVLDGFNIGFLNTLVEAIIQDSAEFKKK